MICEATLFIVANDEEREFHCHAGASTHGLAHVFDVGNIPMEASIVIVPGPLLQVRGEIDRRDIIVKWSPVE